MQIRTNEDTPKEAIEHAPETSVEAEASETRERYVRVTPAVDIFESAEALRVVTDLPGVPREGIELSVERGALTLTATDDARGRVYRRAFRLSDLVDPAKVDASLERGVLTIELGKRDEVQPRRVTIRQG